MYINRTNNHIIKIKDEDLFLLLDRYNLENFEVLETLNGEKVYKNSSKCPFCEKYYKRNCMGCPFKQFEDFNYGEVIFGCENFLKLVMKVIDLDDIYCTVDEVVFYESASNKIHNSLQAVYDFFSSFKHI